MAFDSYAVLTSHLYIARLDLNENWFNDDFYAVVSPASRSSCLGRGSGLIIVLVRRSVFSHDVVKIHPNYIALSLTHLQSRISFALVVHYFSPSLDPLHCCQHLEDNCSGLLHCKYLHVPRYCYVLYWLI